MNIWHKLVSFLGSIENEDPKTLRSTKTKTPYENDDPYEYEDLQKQRPPTKTKTSNENEDPFIFCGKLNNFVGNEVKGVFLFLGGLCFRRS